MTSWGERPEPVAMPERVWEHNAGPAGPRPIIGFVYELKLRGYPEDRHAYVGKREGRTEAAVTDRVHGRSRSAHTSPESVAKDPWKALILPGRQGYRILERVRDTGDDGENDRALRRAETFWIDRLKTEHNDVRPAQPVSAARPARRPAPRPPARPAPQRSRRQPVSSVKVRALLAMMVVFAIAAGLLVAQLGLSPYAPWVAGPIAGSMLGWRVMVRIDRAQRRARRILR